MIGFQFWNIKEKLIHNINFIGLQKPYWSVTKNWKYHNTAFSLNKVFPGSATRYCYFHYTQSLKRQLSEKGVQAREETNLAIGQFRYLYTAARLSAYVPPQDVRQWFEQVKKYTWNKGSPPEKKKFSFSRHHFCPDRFSRHHHHFWRNLHGQCSCHCHHHYELGVCLSFQLEIYQY